MTDKPVGGWLKLPKGSRKAEFERASTHYEKVDVGEGRHAHPPSTGTFTDKNCPTCASK